MIVGAGAAGTAAALSAAETAKTLAENVRIVLIEKSDEDHWGGNSRWTTAFFRMSDEDHLDPHLVEDLIGDSLGKFNNDYALTFVREAMDTMRWVRSNGVTLENRAERFVLPVGDKINVHAAGGGLSIITALRKGAELLGVSVLLETTAYKLSLTSDGVVDGIWVRSRSGKVQKLFCHAVILAGGGFEDNYEMLTKYLGNEATSLRPDVARIQAHMGECINLALEAGAAPSGDYGGHHGMVVDTRSTTFAPNIYAYIHGIIVNAKGERFTDEGATIITESFEEVSNRIFQQPGHIAFIILDKNSIAIPNFEKLILSKVPPIIASSLEELARSINVPSYALRKSLEVFNASVIEGRFDPTQLDGKHTSGIWPPKSNWARPIDTPPFYCYPVEGTIQFTWGGIASDFRARALATNGSPIHGLYVAGEMVGQNYHHYTSGTSVMRALVFGRIAGFEAVRMILKEVD